MSRARILADYVSSGDELAATTTVASAALPKAGGAMTGAITTNSTFDGIDIATRDAVLTSTTTTAGAALPKAGGAMTGAITTNSTFDGIDIATRDGVLTSTTTTANAALPKAGGTMTGNIVMGDDTSIGIADDAERIEFDGAGDISVLGAKFGVGVNPAQVFSVLNPASGSGGLAATTCLIQNNYVGEYTMIVQGAGTGTVPILDLRDGGGNQKVIFRDDGNVGINDTTPSSKLSVNGSIEVSSSGGRGIFFRGSSGDNLVEGGANYDNLSIVCKPSTSDQLEICGYAGLDFKTGYTTRMRIDSSGYVGIGDTPLHHLHVWCNRASYPATLLRNDNSTGYGVDIQLGGNYSNDTSTYFLKCFDPQGAEAYIYGNGSYYQPSDRRIKENIIDVESMLDKVNSLRVVTYNRINDESKGLHIGTVAQEVEEIFPHLITINPAVDAVEEVSDEEGNIITRGTSAQDERYMVYKIGFVFPLIKAVQELSAKVTALENA